MRPLFGGLFIRIMAKYTVAFATLGCRTNQYETDALAEKMKTAGFEVRSFSEKADVYVINTCSVTAEADRKSRQFIRRAKSTNPDAVVIVMGCFSQLNPDKAEELGADYVCGNRNKMSASDYALKALDGKENKKTQVLDLSSAPYENCGLVGIEKNAERAFLKIADGCDNECTYCIIRKARGPVVSRDPDEIKKEAEIFAENGYREIVLTGTEIASYGRENRRYTLKDAISAACSADGIERVRIGSIEPSVLRDDFIEYLASEEKFMPSFHLSLQSGSAGVLARMKRKYNPEMVLKSVGKIRSLMPDAGFSADIIVGFPGETEEEFEDTCRLVKEIGLYHAHIFPYSDRKGTEATAMGGKIPAEVKNRRLDVLSEICRESAEEQFKFFVDSKMPMSVLFEEKKNGMWFGHAQNMFDVEYDSTEDLKGQTLVLLAKEYRNGVVTATPLACV